MTPSNTQSTTINTEINVPSSSKIHTTSAKTSRKKSSKSGKTKIKYNANGSSTVSFKLDKDCVKQQYHTASSSKKRNSSKLMFVDESDANNNSSDTTSQDSSGNCSSMTATCNSVNFNGQHHVNKRLCKLRKQLKSCDHFTDNYFVIDLTSSKGRQNKCLPQVVSFKSPNEHFILHDDENASSHSSGTPKHAALSSSEELDQGGGGAAVNLAEDDNDAPSEDHATPQHTQKKRKKSEQQGNTTKKCKVSKKQQAVSTMNTIETSQQPELMSQHDSSHVTTPNPQELLEELKKQDPMLLAQLLQDLLHQNGSEMFKQMQNMLLSQFQLEVQNLMRQALEQQYAALLPPFDVTTTNLTNSSVQSIESDIFGNDDLLQLLNEEPSTSSNTVNHDTTPTLEFTPTSPLSTLTSNVDQQEILIEQGDCMIE
ncbi:hypothetical protein C9374_002730 [Naegleria lovaniensis]|uniref:Uncharacterized protein n=1 Tax=Naegleria lovaniensis TaxID=51637 RepID=A0AA88GV48_NAELO|nr:uncharacterized protein C9374_002730 [Naegleria lovaniensis]KAG2386284.1 hypothetical protein C9374_002730 [Naegleria lovaniensis]